MKLLFDENLSPSLPRMLVDVFPGSVHVRDVGLANAPDAEVWEYAARYGYTLVSKDDDFRQRALVEGPPPKIVGLLLGNCTVGETFSALRNHAQFLMDFEGDSQATYFAIQRRPGDR